MPWISLALGSVSRYRSGVEELSVEVEASKVSEAGALDQVDELPGQLTRL